MRPCLSRGHEHLASSGVDVGGGGVASPDCLFLTGPHLVLTIKTGDQAGTGETPPSTPMVLRSCCQRGAGALWGGGDQTLLGDGHRTRPRWGFFPSTKEKPPAPR